MLTSLFKSVCVTEYKTTNSSMEFFLNGTDISLNSGGMVNHWGINWVQGKNPVSACVLLVPW